MDFGTQRPSTNFEDRTGDEWYSPNKLLGQVMVAMSRVYDPKGTQRHLDEKQRKMDENPLPPMNWEQNARARVSHQDSRGGRTVTRPGAVFDEYLPGGASGRISPKEEQAIEELIRKTRRR